MTGNWGWAEPLLLLHFLHWMLVVCWLIIIAGCWVVSLPGPWVFLPIPFCPQQLHSGKRFVTSNRLAYLYPCPVIAIPTINTKDHRIIEGKRNLWNQGWFQGLIGLLMALSRQVFVISRDGDFTDLLWHREGRKRGFFVPWQWREGGGFSFAVVALDGSVIFSYSINEFHNWGKSCAFPLTWALISDSGLNVVSTTI